MILPTTITVPIQPEVRRLFVFSGVKVGKTENIMQLPNCLLIDLEDSSGFYPGMAINVKKICRETGKDMLTVLMEIKASIVDVNTKAGKALYDFICLDTTTVLENIARDYGTWLYKQRPGNKYEGSDVVLELPNGAGYGWLRTAFVKIYNSFQALAGKALILSGHVKFTSINKDGKDLQATDVQLTGLLKQIVASDADAIGFMYRNKETNQNILSFKTKELDLITGARLSYLSGKEFIISEKIEDKVITHWDLVFPSLKKTA